MSANMAVAELVPESSDRHVTRATLTSQVENALRRDIIEGLLLPGRRLLVAELTARYSVSATPLREALQRLSAEDLVRIDTRLGATVSDISESDLHDVYWVRGSLEGIALEQSVTLGDAAWKQRVRVSYRVFAEATRAVTRDPSREATIAWSRAHRSFHEALFSASSSPWLLRFVSRLRDYSQRYALLSDQRQTAGTLRQHTEIYRRAIRGDATGAAAALRRHFADVVRRVRTQFILQAADQNGSSGGTIPTRRARRAQPVARTSRSQVARRR